MEPDLIEWLCPNRVSYSPGPVQGFLRLRRQEQDTDNAFEGDRRPGKLVGLAFCSTHPTDYELRGGAARVNW
jgi:hypothetical protein